jgi:hypothetical protein
LSNDIITRFKLTTVYDSWHFQHNYTQISIIKVLFDSAVKSETTAPNGKSESEVQFHLAVFRKDFSRIFHVANGPKLIKWIVLHLYHPTIPSYQVKTIFFSDYSFEQRKHMAETKALNLKLNQHRNKSKPPLPNHETSKTSTDSRSASAKSKPPPPNRTLP